MKEKKFTPAILSILLFSILTFLVVTNASWFIQFDSFIYQFSWKPSEVITALVNLFAKTATIVPVFILSLIISFALWRKNYKVLAFWMSSNVLVVSALGFILKQSVARTRPNVEQLAEKTSYSFPSGHSLLAMCLACSIMLVIQTIYSTDPKKYQYVKIGLVVYVALIGLGRIYLRVHYPSDVLGGFLLSFAWVNLSYALLQKMAIHGNFSMLNVFKDDQDSNR
ncbi:phosphatase PAP2 family protein [Enterococcus quebecensis]|uniref:phosphatase PAP2 family protein n=1 Tax=Enterococcus quebecensis TaxID=903983 RepID=UPI001F0B67A7|nr:phosphatase PAP2 family protein [Enterococcus quebecensis]